MGSNKGAIKVLATLLVIVVVLFLTEKKFLIKEARGAGVSKYENVSWTDKILLLVDDFEGISGDKSVLEKEGFFSYGGLEISTDSSDLGGGMLASKTTLQVKWDGKENYGGWGKGVGKNMDMNTETDHLNFKILVPKNNYTETIKIVIEEDDDNDGILKPEKDDSWFYKLNIKEGGKWQFISIPLKDFSDGNEGGDHILNINRKGGIHTLIFNFEETGKYTVGQKWYFDFICFTTEKVKE